MSHYHVVLIKKPEIVARKLYQSICEKLKSTVSCGYLLTQRLLLPIQYGAVTKHTREYYHGGLLPRTKATNIYSYGENIWNCIAFKLEVTKE